MTFLSITVGWIWLVALCFAQRLEMSDMFDFDQESCAERIMDPYLEDTVKLTDTCLSDHSSLREPMNLFSGFAELRNVARNAHWAWGVESIVERNTDDSTFDEADLFTLSSAQNPLQRVQKFLAKDTSEWDLVVEESDKEDSSSEDESSDDGSTDSEDSEDTNPSFVRVRTSCHENAFVHTTFAARIPQPRSEGALPAVLTVLGHTQDGYEEVWIHKRASTKDTTPRVSRYTNDPSQDVCGGASSTVLGAYQGDTSLDARELVLCDRFFREAKLTEMPALDLLAERRYAAATLLHDVFLLLGRHGQGYRYFDTSFFWFDEDSDMTQYLPLSPADIALLALRPQEFQHVEGDVWGLEQPNTVVLPWAHAWFCLASYFKHISWKIRFYGTLGLVPHITQELEREITQLAEEDHSGLEEPPDLAASGSSDSDETSNSDGSQRDRERGPFDPVSVMDPEAPSDDSDPETPPVRIRK